MACCYSSCKSTARPSELKRCAGCRKVRYCSTSCQTLDWPSHVFDCMTGKPISTVYYLARAIREKNTPTQLQTRVDYGFQKAWRVLGVEGVGPLWRLYEQLFQMLADPYADLRRWQKEGRLVEGIKQTFRPIPPSLRGVHYRWFLDHQYVVDGTPADEDAVTHQGLLLVHSRLRAAWLYAGGSSSDTHDTIIDGITKLAQKSEPKMNCFLFVSFVLADNPPGPDGTMWLSFGLVAGKHRERFWRYAELLNLCTFEELCEAYETSSIPALFARHGISGLDYDCDRRFDDVMSGSPTTFKSVWHLKKYVHEVDGGTPTGEDPCLAQCAICDYGYGNCKKTEEWKLLDALYKQLFAKDDMDLLALHAACLRGELLQFAKEFVKLSPRTATYARLLKNGHPLPDCEESRYVLLSLLCDCISADDSIVPTTQRKRCHGPGH